MKQREPRQKVMLSARLRHESGWSDANILNVSSRGLMLHGGVQPARGSYLEIRRGSCLVIGRVVWVNAHQFGVRTQDKLSIDDLIASAHGASCANDAGGAFIERRARPRSEGLEWRYVKSRDAGKAIQFAAIVTAAVTTAAISYQAANSVLASSLAQVSKHLKVGG